ncbi:MAG: hypothetical protein EZS28_027141 [Streblomastix strix]|uniref:Uncharacterized protein n=1 Tax=Streblomastix strix TaxID=222440 RepID=A0A5J4V4R8_9EUKA|nr:MAG: hypothetical protein EZS28_027141 [Streblomastix strix]
MLSIQELKDRVTRRTNSRAAHLFTKIGGIRALSDDDIRNLIKMFMKQAGLDVSLFSAYSLKAAGLSESQRNGVKLEQIASKSRLSTKGLVLRKHYLLPLQQTNNLAQHSHSSRQTRSSDEGSRFSSGKSRSLGEAEAIEMNAPPVKMKLRDRQRLKPPKAWSSSDDEDQWLSQSE